MSMPTPALKDFMVSVPSCSPTSSLAVALEIFSHGKCDRLVVVNEQQYPIGVLNLRCLMPQLMKSYGYGKEDSHTRPDEYLQQPLFELDVVVEPTTLPADQSVEQFSFYLRSQQSQINTGSDWALVDPTGKFLGLVDSPRLLQFLATFPPARVAINEREQSCVAGGLSSLIQLLELLPWPLMLQTDTGEVVTKNPAWCQQFGILNDPEAVRREVEAILYTSKPPQAEGRQNPEVRQSRELGLEPGVRDRIPPFKDTQHSSPIPTASTYPTFQEELCKGKNSGYIADEEQLSVRSESARPPVVGFHSQPATYSASSSFQCQLGVQPGTCICVWPVPNGQERVFSFVKIPLEESVVSSNLDNKPRTTNHGQLTNSPQIWLLLAQDVTEQQQLAMELAAKNADLIQLNRLKDEFLACISHELKTPLTAVLGLSSLLKDQLLGELNERQARYARLIHESGRHLMTVVNDILDLTRMETGQMELTLEPVKIATVCDRAIQQAKDMQPATSQPSTAGKNLAVPPSDNHRFTVSIEPGLDSLVADEFRLRQMLVHLLSNAFKFTPQGGQIGLQVSRWEGWIAFTVWDNGIGIPEQKQHLIFQKFQQLENPLTRQFDGTGLGLVLTRALARLHGGDISFLSQEGKGSQFTLLLPPSPPPDFRLAISDFGLENNTKITPVSGNGVTSARDLLQNPKLSSMKSVAGQPKIQNPHPNRLVLVVEAAPRFIENLTEQLTGLGYRVVIARSGTEALEKARRLQPKAVFLNPLLPLLSGWDVLTLLKSDAATRQIPAIVTATRAEKERAISNRADDFLVLPVQQQSLQQTLARCTASAQSVKGVSTTARADNRLTILHLTSEYTTHLRLRIEHSALTEVLNAQSRPNRTAPTALNYRVVEADDLEQAELLARIWQPNVVLLDAAMPDPLHYLKQLSQHPRLAQLPLVTLDTASTQAANQVPGLSVFPCLTPAEELETQALFSVLQIAAGMSCQPSLLVVDVATLPDLPEVSGEGKSYSSLLTPNSSLSAGSEWFQALIQYLQTAGFRAMMSRSWAEVLQQIRQQSVDLLLLCLGDSKLHPDVKKALTALTEQHEAPPILILDRRLSQGEVRKQFHYCLEEAATVNHSEVRTRCAVSVQATAQADAVESLETVLGAVATQILPPSLSMEALLTKINHTLALKGKR